MKDFREVQGKIREILFSDGWVFKEDAVDFTIYGKTMDSQDCKSQYGIDLQVLVSDNEQGLRWSGELGICAFYVEGFNRGALPPYSVQDLKDFLNAIQVAENQLLLAGAPFFTDYEFEVNREEKTMQNHQVREAMNLAQIEERTRAIIWA